MERLKGRIEFLDLCRILAVLSVFLGHKFYSDIAYIVNFEKTHIIIRESAMALLPFAEGGGFGVILFFCVSGYIIRYVLETENWCEFYIKRFFRIFPLYWCAVILWYFVTPSNERPELSTLILQLSLFGDFLHLPYTLDGVEWTLRLEILFYLIMGILKSIKILDFKNAFLSSILFAFGFIIYLFPAWPQNNLWSSGYVSIHLPFLFLGVYFREYEKNFISKSLLIFFIIITIFFYCKSIEAYQPNWSNSRFAVLGIMVFGILFWMQSKISMPRWALSFSEMTYSIYLFHNFLFDVFMRNSLLPYNSKIISSTLLLLFCFMVNRFVEKPGIKMGKKIIKQLRLNYPTNSPR